MISYDDTFYRTYKNTDKELELVDRLGNKNTYILKEDDTDGLSYHPVAGGKCIHYDYVSWNLSELFESDHATHWIASKHVKVAKEQALEANITTELMRNIEAYTRYFDYYKNQSKVFTVYALANYDVRQENRSCIVARFEHKADIGTPGFGDMVQPEHKLIGVAPTYVDYGNRVVTVTNEAWRYEPLPWSKIREICPAFVQGVLNGQEP